MGRNDSHLKSILHLELNFEANNSLHGLSSVTYTNMFSLNTVPFFDLMGKEDYN